MLRGSFSFYLDLAEFEISLPISLLSIRERMIDFVWIFFETNFAAYHFVDTRV